MPKAIHALNTSAAVSAKPSRRRLLTAGAALAAAGAAPVAAAATAIPDADAELIRLADQAVAACRGYAENMSDEVDAELDRLSALASDCYRRAAEIPATTDAGKRAKARIVTLANSHNLSCVGDTAFLTLESLLDDLMGGKGSAAALDGRVNYREGAV